MNKAMKYTDKKRSCGKHKLVSDRCPCNNSICCKDCIHNEICLRECEEAYAGRECKYEREEKQWQEE